MIAALIIFGCMALCFNICKSAVDERYGRIRRDGSTYETSPRWGVKMWLTADEWTVEYDHMIDAFKRIELMSDTLWVYTTYHVGDDYFQYLRDTLSRWTGAKLNEDRWNIDNVNDFSDMFDGATCFDQDLSGWHVAGSGINTEKKYSIKATDPDDAKRLVKEITEKCGGSFPQIGSCSPQEIIDSLTAKSIDWDVITDKPATGVNLPEVDGYEPGEIFHVITQFTEEMYVMSGMSGFKEWIKVKPTAINFETITDTFNVPYPDGMITVLDDKYDFRHNKVFVVRAMEAFLVKRGPGDMDGFTLDEYREETERRFLCLND